MWIRSVFVALLVVAPATAWAGKPACGDGTRQKKEQCDGSDLAGQTCVGLGYSGGTLGCNGDCTFDTSGCTTSSVPVCGDNSVEGNEECDGTSDSACPGKCSRHCACPAAAATGRLRVHMVDVGQGDALVIVSPDGFVAVMDAGTGSQAATVNAYLTSLGLGRVNYTIASHMDADHIGGLDGVLAAHPEVVACFDHGGSVGTSEYGSYNTTAGNRRVTVVPGNTIDMGPQMTVEVLHAHAGASNENDNSVVLRLSYGANTVLLGGDCEAACEASFVPGPIQVYKVHHHGADSSSTSAFLDSMQPYTALISAGADNPYGHPDSTVLQALAARQVTVYGTYDVGHITVDADGTAYTVNSAPVCSGTQTRTCGTTDVGACTYGSRSCVNGMWGSCSGAVEPVAENCTNSVDDDCDGATDGNDSDCAAGATNVLIAHVVYDTPGTDSVEEYVELYNPTGQSVDLSGWKLVDPAGSWTIPNGTSIAAGAWLTIARDAAGFQAWTGKQADVAGLSLSLNNGGDQLILRDASSTEVDFVAWEGYVSGWDANASTGDSIERTDPNVDSDSGGDWRVKSPASPYGSQGGGSGGSCGDGVCGAGEDCTSCATDCIGKTGGKPSTRYCCGNGTCESAGETSGNCAIDCG